MTLLDPAHEHFEHTAVFYDATEELTDQLAPMVEVALGRHEAVLVSLSAARWQPLAARLGELADRVTYLEAGDRYSRPTHALAALHTFVRQALADGAPVVWSIGEVDFGGPLPGADWIRYEAAVNDVLRHLPLRAVCAYDRSALADDLLDAACRTHRTVLDEAGRRSSAQFRPPTSVVADLARPEVAPDGVPLLHLEAVRDVGDARRAAVGAVAGALAGDRLADLELVVSELVTNASMHGAGPVSFALWATEAAVTVEVTDAGDGLADPFPELRLPTPGPGGLGLWVVGQVSDRVTVDRVRGRTVVRVTLPR